MTGIDIEKELRSLSDDGYIRFNIRSKNTEHNADVHKEFKSYAKEVCDDNYTLAVEKLLDYAKSDAKTEMLWEAIKQLNQRVDEMQPSESKEEEKGKAF